MQLSFDEVHDVTYILKYSEIFSNSLKITVVFLSIVPCLHESIYVSMRFLLYFSIYIPAYISIYSFVFLLINRSIFLMQVSTRVARDCPTHRGGLGSTASRRSADITQFPINRVRNGCGSPPNRWNNKLWACPAQARQSRHGLVSEHLERQVTIDSRRNFATKRSLSPIKRTVFIYPKKLRMFSTFVWNGAWFEVLRVTLAQVSGARVVQSQMTQGWRRVRSWDVLDFTLEPCVQCGVPLWLGDVCSTCCFMVVPVLLKGLLLLQFSDDWDHRCLAVLFGKPQESEFLAPPSVWCTNRQKPHLWLVALNLGVKACTRKSLDVKMTWTTKNTQPQSQRKSPWHFRKSKIFIDFQHVDVLLIFQYPSG